MGRKPESIQSAIRIRESHAGYSDATKISYKGQANAVFKIVREFQPDAIPSTVTEETAKEFISALQDRYEISTQRIYYYTLKTLCEQSNNHIFDRITIFFGEDTRPHVDWLTSEQAITVLQCPKTPLEELIISLELLHGLRRTEVVRLQITDIRDGYLTVTGKGHTGGKKRSIPFHRSFLHTFQRWIRERNEIISTAKAINPSVSIPTSLLLYHKGRSLYSYDSLRSHVVRTALAKVSDQCGIAFTSHTLRRTFGREMWHSGVSIVVIAKILGHSSTDMTLRYIGANYDDMVVAMSQFNIGGWEQ